MNEPEGHNCIKISAELALQTAKHFRYMADELEESVKLECPNFSIEEWENERTNGEVSGYRTEESGRTSVRTAEGDVSVPCRTYTTGKHSVYKGD